MGQSLDYVKMDGAIHCVRPKINNTIVRDEEKHMKIGMMVRSYLPVPRPSDMIYAPIDLAAEIGKGLAKRGHDITFFAPNGSHIQGVNVEDLHMRPLVHTGSEFNELIHDVDKQMHYIPGLWDQKMAAAMFQKAKQGDLDLLHFHHPEVAMPFAVNNTDIPVAYTLHDPINNICKELYGMYKSPNQHYLSISDNQRRDGPDLNYHATTYNGIDVDKYTFGEEHEDYLMIAGRIVPNKGFKEAIQVAKATDQRLLIIGPVFEDSQEYFDQHIKPHLNDKILYLGFMEQEQMITYYQKAKAFILPLQWEEPFGLVMVEAMACGTPVIVLRRGSAEEVVVDGKTGFICDHTQDMIEAVKKIDDINRKDCRSHVEKNFSIETMVDGYEKAFSSILGKNKKQTPTTTGSRYLKNQVRRIIKTAKAQK